MKPIALLILLSVYTITSAQQFGAFPPKTKWKQINTDTVRIIFTPGAESHAERIATLIHRTPADTPFALGKKLRKVNILLHSHTTLANGYVALAPFRSEFYLIPGSSLFDFGSLPWEDNLAIHEYRHVQQYNNFNHGLSRGFYFLFGEQGLAFANALAVPDWFFEGDAVHSETALTPQGRGRQPFFQSGYRSLILDRRKYSWQKLRNGSLKDYVPDHYHLGYILTNYGYEKYGPDFWKQVTRDASAFRPLFYPFQGAIKKYTGISYRQFRQNAFAFFSQDLKSSDMPARSVKTVTDYYFPQWIGPDSLLYLKTSYKTIPSFYLKDSGGEHKIRMRSLSAEEWFGYRKGKIVYTAYDPDHRWGLTDYSDIVMLDVSSRKERRITHHDKYYSPDLSPSGEQISAIRINDSLATELRILQSTDGKILKTFQLPGKYFTNPRFIDDSRLILGVRTHDARMSLQEVDITTGAFTRLTPDSYSSMGVPSVKNDTVYFTGSFSGNDDLYALTLSDHKIFQLTRRYTGTYYPSVRGGSLVFSQFTGNGLLMETSALHNLLWEPVNTDSLQVMSSHYQVALEKNILGIANRKFTVNPYSRSTHLFNFHSWAPDYEDPEFTFTLYGDNILNTFSTNLYYRYNQNENSHGIGWNSSYGGFFPQLNAGAEYTFNRHDRLQGRNRVYDQFEAHAGYNIPLIFSKSKFYRFLNFGSNFVFNRTIPDGLFGKDSLHGLNSTYLHHFISWSQYKPRAVQHINPKLGYTYSAAFRHFLNSRGSQFLTTAQVFLPSVANHSIVLTGSWQETIADTNDIVFANRFALSRGYSDFYFVRMWKVSANYHFPIVYPDFGVASIVYFQRLRGNVFYDYSRVYNFIKQPLRNLRSVGGELFFDTRWWNQQPVSFGIRVSHLLDNGFNSLDRRGSNYFEFILPVNLIPN